MKLVSSPAETNGTRSAEVPSGVADAPLSTVSQLTLAVLPEHFPEVRTYP